MHMLCSQSRSTHAILWIAILLLSSFLSATNPGQTLLLDWSGDYFGQIPPPWKLIVNHGKSDLTWIKTADGQTLKLFCDRASFALERKVDIDTNQYPILKWSWMVTQIPENGDFRTPRRDDQAAQLFVLFGRSKAIVYLWDSNAPAGLVAQVNSPPFITVKAMVLRSGQDHLGSWQCESRNLRQDFITAFGGSKFPLITGIRIQINSQHTAAVAESYLRDIIFVAAQ